MVQKRVAPILKLDDIGLKSQRANLRGIALDDDTAPGARDNVRVSAVDRRFEQQERLLDIARQLASDRRMGLTDAAAQMSGNVQNSHAAASVTSGPETIPPGAVAEGSR